VRRKRNRKLYEGRERRSRRKIEGKKKDNLLIFMEPAMGFEPAAC
jgi:hypothetical protein